MQNSLDEAIGSYACGSVGSFKKIGRAMGRPVLWLTHMQS